MMTLRRLELPGILIFSVGFALKFFHIPHNAVLMLLGLGCLLLSLLGAIRGGENVPKRLTSRLTSILSLAALLCVIKFFPIHDYVLLLAGLAILWMLYLVSSKKQRLVVTHYTALLAVLLTVVLGLVWIEVSAILCST